MKKSNLKWPSFSDTAGLAGVGLISFGSWLVYHPAGFIVSGALLLTLAVLTARAS